MELFDWSVWKMALAARSRSGIPESHGGNRQYEAGYFSVKCKKKGEKREEIVNLADFIFIESFSFIPKKKSRFDRFYIHSIILIYSAAH